MSDSCNIKHDFYVFKEKFSEMAIGNGVARN